MQLRISNVGKIERAVIDIDGITVIAGENNAGKSTIGKLIFAVFNSLNGMDDKVEAERKNRIYNIIRTTMQERVFLDSEPPVGGNIKVRVLAKELSDAIMERLHDGETVDAGAFIKEKMKEYSSGADAEGTEECINRVGALLAVSDKRVMTEVITRWFGEVFQKQFSPLGKEETESKIDIEIKKKTVSLIFKENACTDWNSDLGILHQAFYIDNPFIVDKMSASYTACTIMEKHLLGFLRNEPKDIYADIFDAVMAKDKLEEINRILGEVIEGDIEEGQDGNYCVRSNQYNKPINVINLSTGMKSFAVIKKLLQSGSIKQKDVVILDEPEIHLHPEWQLLYAKMIVLLQKEFDLSMIITTHSPYFLDAIDVYSSKYGIADKTRYYLAENVGAASVLNDVTGNLDAIYKKLSDPLQMLENLRYNG